MSVSRQDQAETGNCFKTVFSCQPDWEDLLAFLPFHMRQPGRCLQNLSDDEGYAVHSQALLGIREMSRPQIISCRDEAVYLAGWALRNYFKIQEVAPSVERALAALGRVFDCLKFDLAAFAESACQEIKTETIVRMIDPTCREFCPQSEFEFLARIVIEENNGMANLALYSMERFRPVNERLMNFLESVVVGGRGQVSETATRVLVKMSLENEGAADHLESALPLADSGALTVMFDCLNASAEYEQDTAEKLFRKIGPALCKSLSSAIDSEDVALRSAAINAAPLIDSDSELTSLLIGLLGYPASARSAAIALARMGNTTERALEVIRRDIEEYGAMEDTVSALIQMHNISAVDEPLRLLLECCQTPGYYDFHYHLISSQVRLQPNQATSRVFAEFMDFDFGSAREGGLAFIAELVDPTCVGEKRNQGQVLVDKVRGQFETGSIESHSPVLPELTARQQRLQERVKEPWLLTSAWEKFERAALCRRECAFEILAYLWGEEPLTHEVDCGLLELAAVAFIESSSEFQFCSVGSKGVCCTSASPGSLLARCSLVSGTPPIVVKPDLCAERFEFLVSHFNLSELPDLWAAAYQKVDTLIRRGRPLFFGSPETDCERFALTVVSGDTSEDFARIFAGWIIFGDPELRGRAVGFVRNFDHLDQSVMVNACAMVICENDESGKEIVDAYDTMVSRSDMGTAILESCRIFPSLPDDSCGPFIECLGFALANRLSHFDSIAALCWLLALAGPLSRFRLLTILRKHSDPATDLFSGESSFCEAMAEESFRESILECESIEEIREHCNEVFWRRNAFLLARDHELRGRRIESVYLRALNSGDLSTRSAALEALETIEDPAESTIVRLMELLRAEVMVPGLAQTVGKIAQSNQFLASELLSIACGTEPEESLRAIEALSHSDRFVVEIADVCLHYLTRDEERWERSAEVLVRMGVSASRLLPELSGRLPHTTAIKVIGQLRPVTSQAVALLTRVLRDKNTVAVSYAISALEGIGWAAAESLSGLNDVVCRDPDGTCALQCLRALAQITSSDALVWQALHVGLRAKDADWVDASLSCCGHIKVTQLPLVEALLRLFGEATDDRRKRKCIHALKNISTMRREAVDALVTALDADTVPDVELALDAIEALIQSSSDLEWFVLRSYCYRARSRARNALMGRLSGLGVRLFMQDEFRGTLVYGGK